MTNVCKTEYNAIKMCDQFNTMIVVCASIKILGGWGMFRVISLLNVIFAVVVIGIAGVRDAYSASCEMDVLGNPIALNGCTFNGETSNGVCTGALYAGQGTCQYFVNDSLNCANVKNQNIKIYKDYFETFIGCVYDCSECVNGVLTTGNVADLFPDRCDTANPSVYHYCKTTSSTCGGAGSCSTAADCADGESCKNGCCSSGGSAPCKLCSANSDCGSGFTCASGCCQSNTLTICSQGFYRSGFDICAPCTLLSMGENVFYTSSSGTTKASSTATTSGTGAISSLACYIPGGTYYDDDGTFDIDDCHYTN